jgi:hypothetical protein
MQANSAFLIAISSLAHASPLEALAWVKPINTTDMCDAVRHKNMVMLRLVSQTG